MVLLQMYPEDECASDDERRQQQEEEEEDGEDYETGETQVVYSGGEGSEHSGSLRGGQVLCGMVRTLQL